MTRPLESFSDQDILLAAMAMNRGIVVSGEPENSDAMTRLLGDLLNYELTMRQMNPRKMAQELFRRILDSAQLGLHGDDVNRG